MPADVRSLLEDAAGPDSGLPDVDAIIGRGLRRRRRAHLVQGLSGLAAVVVLALVGSVQLDGLRSPPLLLDSPPKAGAGSWELVPDAPLEPAEDAEAFDLGDGTVLVVGGTEERRDRGTVATFQAARYGVATRTWTVVPPVPFPRAGDDQADSRVRTVPADDGTVAVWRERLTEPGPFEAAVFDPRGNRWVATGPLPGGHRSQPTVAWVGGRLLVWGGARGVAETQPVNPRSPEEALGPGDLRSPVEGGAVWVPSDAGRPYGGGSWQPMAPSPLAARIDAATLTLDGRLVVWGGADAGVDVPDRRLFADGAVYDVAADTWVMLPPAPLSPRSSAEILRTEEGFLLVNGLGEATITVQRSGPRPCTEGEGNCTTTESYGRSYDYEEPRDGARFDLGDRSWAALPPLPRGVTGYAVDGDDLSALDGSVLLRWDARGEEWVADPPSQRDYWDGVSRPLRLGDLVVRIRIPTPMEVTRLGGTVDVGGESQPLAEADTPARMGPALTAVGDEAVFVWGGTSRVPGVELDDGHRAFRQHRDGAVWRP